MAADAEPLEILLHLPLLCEDKVCCANHVPAQYCTHAGCSGGESRGAHCECSLQSPYAVSDHSLTPRI